MHDQLPPLLSDLLADARDEGFSAPRFGIDRRRFLLNASRLGLILPAVGATLEACSKGGPSAGSNRAGQGESAGAAAGASHQNPDSRTDTSLRTQHTPSSATAPATAGASSVAFHRYDPALPPLPTSRTLSLKWTAKEVPVRISASTVVAGWTFEGDIPGPIVHCRVGDTVDFTLTVEGQVPHSMDFHAAQIDPKTAFRSVVPGQSLSFSFKPKYAGAFMYHCGTAPVLMHIGSGMFGAIIVDPIEPLSAAKEFVLVQNEYYLAAAAGGVQASATTRCWRRRPTSSASTAAPAIPGRCRSA